MKPPSHYFTDEGHVWVRATELLEVKQGYNWNLAHFANLSFEGPVIILAHKESNRVVKIYTIVFYPDDKQLWYSVNNIIWHGAYTRREYADDQLMVEEYVEKTSRHELKIPLDKAYFAVEAQHAPLNLLNRKTGFLIPAEEPIYQGLGDLFRRNS